MNFPGQSGERMGCPRCGAAMNHHADKVLYFNEDDETRSPIQVPVALLTKFMLARSAVPALLVKSISETRMLEPHAYRSSRREGKTETIDALGSS